MTMSLSELINAVKLGRISDVQRYISSGWSVNSNDADLVTCLHWASRFGHLEIVKYLCERGAKIDAITKRGNTPLMSAVINGYPLVTQYIIDKGANINKFNGDGLTPLHQAAMHGLLAIAKILTEKGAHVNSCSSDGNTPLFLATKYGREEVVMHLIDSGADVNMVNNEGETALDVANSQKHSRIATILTKPTKIISPHLIKTNAIETIKTLISNHANVNKPYKNNETPLLCAVKTKKLEIIKYLLDNGAEFSIHSAFLESIGTGNEEIVKLLLDKGANVNRQYKSGSTPLLKAVEVENYEISKLLIQNGADVNLTDQSGRTPLLKAIELENDGISKLLIQNGADLNLSDQSGYTPLTKAVLLNFKIGPYLVEKGANVNQIDNHQNSPLVLAARNFNLKLLDDLVKSGGDVEQNEEQLYLAASENEDLEIYLQNLRLKEKEKKGVDATITEKTTAASSKNSETYFSGQEEAL